MLAFKGSHAERTPWLPEQLTWRMGTSNGMSSQLLNQFAQLTSNFHRKQVFEPRNNRIVEGVSSLIQHADSLLDVGAGTGSTAKRVAERIGAPRVEGIDIKIWDGAELPIRQFNGIQIPFEDNEFDVVMLCDVLHHAENPKVLMQECLRVAKTCVIVKDHIAYGNISRYWLYAMDVAGNTRVDVKVIGNYLSMPQWINLFHSCHARMTHLQWPFVVHHWPFSLLAPSNLQFLSRIESLVG